MVVTSECLLDPSRNPSLDKAGIENMLKQYLGLKKIIWLWKGMMGDDQVGRGPTWNPHAGPELVSGLSHAGTGVCVGTGESVTGVCVGTGEAITGV